MFCFEVERLRDEMLLRRTEGNVSNNSGCRRQNLITGSFTPMISPGNGWADPRLCVSVKWLMSGISQRGLAASHEPGSAAVSAEFTAKNETFPGGKAVSARARTGGIFFWITFPKELRRGEKRSLRFFRCRRLNYSTPASK